MSKRDAINPEFIQWRGLWQLQDTDTASAIYVKSWHFTFNALLEVETESAVFQLREVSSILHFMVTGKVTLFVESLLEVSFSLFALAGVPTVW